MSVEDKISSSSILDSIACVTLPLQQRLCPAWQYESQETVCIAFNPNTVDGCRHNAREARGILLPMLF